MSYYNDYLDNHSNPKCRLLHFIGQWVTIFFTIFVLYNWYWYLIPLIPFVIYPFAISGHILFGEKGDKPSFKKMGFVQAKISDWIMFKDIMLGRLKIW
tara:strand:- start:719 stop:1012 length:294 start_codon:yes stop_codon:yes gene_type:complete